MDPRSLFCFSGIAERLARRNGYHRAGRIKGVSIFDAEMRKRVWWQVMVLESRLAELSGCSASIITALWDAEMPANVNDSDLDPGMTIPPRVHEGATEMLFCLTRYEVAEFKRQLRQANGLATGFYEVSGLRNKSGDIGRALDRLQQRLHDKYLSHCDPQLPFHHITLGCTKFAIDLMRYSTYGSHSIVTQDASTSIADKQHLFELCIDMLETHVGMTEDPTLKKYHFFLHSNNPFAAIIHVLFNLRLQQPGSTTDRAWDVIMRKMASFASLNLQGQHAPNKFGGSPLFIALSTLFIKAWDAREQAAQGGTPLEVPAVVSRLRQRLAESRSSSTTPAASSFVSDSQLDHPQVAHGGMGLQTFTQFDHNTPMEDVLFPYLDSDQLNLSTAGSFDFWNGLVPGSGTGGDVAYPRTMPMFV